MARKYAPSAIIFNILLPLLISTIASGYGLHSPDVNPKSDRRSCAYRDASASTVTRNIHTVSSQKHSSPRTNILYSQQNDRRSFLTKSAASLLAVATATKSFDANAFDAETASADIRSRVNKAVTQSDLGISVRKSVVRGAQVMDKVDGNWERFSDRFSLGSERSRREGRPEQKIIPKPLPLNSSIANQLLQASDSVFVSLVPFVSDGQLSSKIAKVQSLVRKSFERAGLPTDTGNEDHLLDGPTFNYLAYSHFKAYSDIIIENESKINFGKFRKDFEGELGRKIVDNIIEPANHADLVSIVGSERKRTSDELKKAFSGSLRFIDAICSSLQSNGLVSIAERSNIDEEDIDDWSQDLADLQFNVALDGDITLGSQMLLQEQGFRLYPDFGRFAVTAALEKYLGGLNEDVKSDEYYMDTDYNSDPDKFEVKEVLLNIVIESK